MSMNIKELAKKIPKYRNVEDYLSEGELDKDFWNNIGWLGFSNIDEMARVSKEADSSMPVSFSYCLDSLSGNNKLFRIIVPFRNSSELEPFSGREIKGIVYISQSKTLGGYEYNINRDMKGYFIPGIMMDDKLKESLIEVLERPFLYISKRTFYINHYICPSPEFLESPKLLEDFEAYEV